MTDVFVLTESNQDELTHSVLGVFAEVGDAKAYAHARAVFENLGDLTWNICSHTRLEAEAGVFGWEICQQEVR